MADRNTARIFQEMRDSDSLRADMRQGILTRTHDALAGLYGSAVAKELVSGLQDVHRRLIEQGWFGQDVFDGRWQAERPEGLTQDRTTTDPTTQGYGQQFYGWTRDRAHDQDTGHDLER